MKKILQINSVINSGSTGRIAEGIGQIAILNGWKSYIAYGRNEQASESKKIKIGNRLDISLHGLKTRILDQHGFGSHKATQDFIQKINTINPDIIHLHNIHGYYLNIELLFQYLSTINTPIIWTLHDCWPFTGHCTHFSFSRCNKWKTHCEKCPQTKSYPTSFFIDNSYKNYERKLELFTSVKNMIIVPVSYWLRDIVRESFLKDYPVEIIHNGIDTDVFKPINNLSIRDKYNLNDKFILLGVASVWSKMKGLNDFIKLSQILSQDDRIILVGLDKKQMKNLPPNIIALKRTENITELAELYTIANVFINPTWEDSFPTTNLEAMACGTPVITYRTGGSPESVISETGFVIEQGDIDGLIQTIHHIKKQGKEQYRDACRKRVIECYNKEDKFNQYIALYNKILNI